MNNFPEANTLKQAITTYESGLVTNNQIDLLHKAWPKDSDLLALEKLNSEKTENEIWNRAEEYMLDLVYPVSIYNRLTVWVFKSEFAFDKIWMNK